uniref:Uncharacterized protein n=1 Tax=Anopheles dirus TaxID=7168 RepID=A0A182N559_9DIPT
MTAQIKILNDVVGDDESSWHDRVSSGFDRLVAFASTELDKTRRSNDVDVPPSSASCTTSPDSGINQSDHSRTFLSPPLSDVGLPRTPSPTSSPPLLFGHPTATNPIAGGGGPPAAVGNSVAPTDGQPSLLQPPGAEGVVIGGNNGAASGVAPSGNNNSGLGIPLKYQRQSKSSSSTSEKHYKKKFRERNWEEYEESLSGGRNSAISGGEPMEQQDYHVPG